MPSFSGRILGVAGTGPREANQVEEGVLFAVDPDFHEFEKIARGRALDPEFVAAGAPERGFALFERGLQGQLVSIPDNEDLSGLGVLDHHRDDFGSCLGDLQEFSEVELQMAALFKFR